MRIRQVALVAAELDPLLADLCAVLGIEVAFRDPGVETFGLHNGVMPIGHHFLEVVSPIKEGTSAGRYLERRGGDGGYMVIFQTRDLAASRLLAETAAVRTVWEIALDDIATVHLHPRDTGGAIVSIDEARPWESWRWAGPNWPGHVRTDRVRALAGVEIQGDDPEALARHWSAAFGLPFHSDAQRPAGSGDGVLLRLEDGGWISFVRAKDGRGEGLRSVALAAVDATALRKAALARALSVDEDGAVLLGGVRFLAV